MTITEPQAASRKPQASGVARMKDIDFLLLRSAFFDIGAESF